MSEGAQSRVHLPRKVQILLIGNFLSAIGSGLVLPYLFIYLHNVRGISSSITGVIVGYSAFAALLLSPFVGSLIDHWGPRPVLLSSLVVNGVGYASLSLVHNVVEALLSMSIIAVGGSAFWPSQSAITAELTFPELRPRAFGANFALLNLGFGVGGVIASTVVDSAKPHTFETLYVVNGLSFSFYFLIVYSLGKVGHRSEEERVENASRDGGWKEVFADKTFLKYWLVSLFALLFGYSQLEVGFASFSTLVAKVAVAKIAYAYAVNCLFIAIFQLFISKRVARINRNYALSAAAIFWLFAWVALSLAGIDHRHALFFIILCQAIFGLGEMVWSPLTPSIVNQLAPEHLRGRYNAASANAWQFALILGPIIAGTLLGAGLHWIWIGGLVTGLAIVSIFAARLKGI